MIATMNRTLAIAMIAPFGIRPKGTLAARMLPLGQALVRRGHRVTIVAPPIGNPEDAGTTAVRAGVTLVHTARVAREPLGLAQQSFALACTALASGPDLLHLFKPKGYGGLAALGLRLLRPRLPLVVDSDDWEGWGGWNDLLPYPLPAKWLFAWQERDLPLRADAVTAASLTLLGRMRAWGVAPERLVYLPNGTHDPQPAGHGAQIAQIDGQIAQEPGARSQEPGATLLLYTRFWELDVAEVVAALVAIRSRRPDVRLRLIGRGERGEERELLRLAERAGVGGAIEYLGWMEPDVIPAALAAADVALMPMCDTPINRARGLAKLLELMQTGLPIVASRVGMAAEYLTDGASGLLVRPGDAGALAGAALRLLDDPALRARLGVGAREAARAYRWDVLAERAEDAYRIAVELKTIREH